MSRWPPVPLIHVPARVALRLRRWARPALIITTVVALGWLVVAAMVFPKTPGWGYDFEAYLLAAQRLARGAPLYQAWTVDGPFRPGPYGLYLYAPPLGVALVMVTSLSVPAATALWFLIRVALLLSAFALMPVKRWIRVLTFAVAVVSEPVLTDLNLGNVSIIVMFLSVVAWRFVDRAPSGVALAAAIALRPTFGLFLIWTALRRRWRVVLAMLGGGAVLVLVTLPVVGIGGYADYVGVIRNLADVTGVPNNMDVGSTLVRLGFPQVIASFAVAAGYAIAIGAVLFSLRRDAELSFMVTLGATLLLSPLLWDHYLVNALLPAAFLLQRGRGPGLLVAALVVPWVPLVGVPLVAVAAMLGPFLAAPSKPLGYAARSEGSPDPGSGSTPEALAEPAGSKRTAIPA